jgi:hypothetical protein
MNNRIKELLNQCTNEYMEKPWPLVDAEKFAELIVRECIDILDKAVYLATREDGEQEYIDVVLLEHFDIDD